MPLNRVSRAGVGVARPSASTSRHKEEQTDARRPRPSPDRERRVYFTDRGIEELAQRRGDEEVSLAWLADRLQEFVDLNPEFEVPVERLATWLARLTTTTPTTTDPSNRPPFEVERPPLEVEPPSVRG